MRILTEKNSYRRDRRGEDYQVVGSLSQLDADRMVEKIKAYPEDAQCLVEDLIAWINRQSKDGNLRSQRGVVIEAVEYLLACYLVSRRE